MEHETYIILDLSSPRFLLQEYPSLRKQLWLLYLSSRGYMAVSPVNITDEIMQKYTENQKN